jgi:hypothetical protein
MKTRYVAFGLSAAVIAFLLIYLYSASLTLNSPLLHGTYCNSVPVEVSWQGRLEPTTFKAQLGNTDVTTSFKPLPATPPAKASLTITPGTSVLTVSAVVLPRLIPGFLAIITKTATTTFAVDELTITPANVAIAPGSTGSANLARTCLNISTAAAAQVLLTSDKPATADSSQPTVTVPAMQTQALLPLKSGSRPGKATIDASISSVSRAKLAVTVKRATGCFSQLTPNFAQIGGTRNSPDGTFGVSITSQQNPTPPPIVWYFAQFKKGNQNVGPSVQFAVDTAGGGAGFCAASNVGAVLSGYAGTLGQSSDYAFSLIDLLATAPPARELPVWSKSAGPGGQPILYGPTLQLSNDCTLAVIAGAHPQGGPEKHQLRVVDVLSGNTLPNGEMGFNGSAISACVVDSATGQRVDISIDNVPQSPSIAIPQ